MVSAEALGSRDLTMQVIDVMPGAVSKPGHMHNNCEEVIYVVSGDGDILIDGEVHHLSAGDAVFVPRGKPHLTRNPGAETMRLVCVFSTTALKEGMVGVPDLDYPGGA